MSSGIADSVKPTLDARGTTAQVEFITRTQDRAAGTTFETPTAQSPDPKCVTENFEANRIDGTNVRFGDLMATFLAQDLDQVPERETTRVQIFGVWYTVLRYETFADGDEVAAYRLHLRS